MPNVEISISNKGWGGDFSIDSTGDLVLAQDVPNEPVATQQRVYRLLLTSPRTFDPNTNLPCSVPDDLFAPSYGAGIRLRVGQMVTPSLIGQLESDINAGLNTDPTIVANPPPSVKITNAGSNTVQIELDCTAVSGEVVTVPSFPFSLSGA